MTNVETWVGFKAAQVVVEPAARSLMRLATTPKLG